jgi:hypothetical protein
MDKIGSFAGWRGGGSWSYWETGPAQAQRTERRLSPDSVEKRRPRSLLATSSRARLRGRTGAGALAVNLSCALMLARYRRHGGSLTRAAFLSARNDAVANIAIIAAGVVTAIMPSVWPDLIVGLGIAAMNADAAREVWQAAREEHKAAEA